MDKLDIQGHVKVRSKPNHSGKSAGFEQYTHVEDSLPTHMRRTHFRHTCGGLTSDTYAEDSLPTHMRRTHFLHTCGGLTSYTHAEDSLPTHILTSCRRRENSWNSALLGRGWSLSLLLLRRWRRRTFLTSWSQTCSL